MNNLEKVSIGGRAFTMDAEAYKKTDGYLKDLEAFYGSRPEGREILEGIEERMSELFIERCGSSGVIDLRVAEETLAILGKPAQIEEESKAENTENTEESPEDGKKSEKKLYRDVDNKMLGGVLAGIAAYFKVDITAVRILFLLLCVAGIYVSKRAAFEFNLLLPLAYVVMWICMPAARTVKEKLKLHGEKGTVSEIEKNLADGTAEYRVQQSNSSELWRVLFKILGIFIGVFLIVTAISSMIGACSFFVGAVVNSSVAEWWGDLLKDVPNIKTLVGPILAKIGLALIVFLPLLGMIYGGLKLVFDFKSPKWHPGLVIFLCWIGTIMAFTVWTAIKMASLF